MNLEQDLSVIKSELKKLLIFLAVINEESSLKITFRCTRYENFIVHNL